MRPSTRTVAAMALFAAAAGVLKGVVALVPAEGLFREDGLFPLWARWERATVWGWFAPPLAAAALLAIPGVRRRIAALPRGAFLAGSIAAATLMFVSLASTHGGFPAGLTAPFEREADYWSSVSSFHSLRDVWGSWVERQPGLSLHART